MQRFYYSELQKNWTFQVDDMEIIHQITKVMRSRVGDTVIFFDGKQWVDVVCEIAQIEKKSILFIAREIIEKKSDFPEIVLYQALPNKLEKIEWILQKWVEVGYTKFVFFRSSRSQDLKISENKLERLQKILLEAVEQSGRNDIPEMIFEQKLDISVILWEKYFFHTDQNVSQKLREIIPSKQPKNIFVWPEWWFSPEEIATFLQYKCIAVTLWKNILRTETASIAVGFYFFQQNF